ncbi:MAG: nucleoside hydrolase [Ruminococcaceae bacterium]|nr:nucleoside hydrolase [Oscillospiraceae bacterium]
MLKDYLPKGMADVVLDTDAYNEIDDLFAIVYLLKSQEKLKTKAIYAAPFLNERSDSPEDGMKKSYQEIKKVLKMINREDVPVFYGASDYLPSEQEGVCSQAVLDLVTRAMNYTPENPLFVVAIGAITNIASALLLKPEIKEKIVVVWLGGHALDHVHNKEFNLYQDIAAARVVFGCGVRLCQLPCLGVVDSFRMSRPEFREWLKGNEISKYLADVSVALMNHRGFDAYASKVIWDVTAVAWLLNEENNFMEAELISSPIPEYNHQWTITKSRHKICYVTKINTNNLMKDMIKKIVH